MRIYDLSAKLNNGRSKQLKEYRGKVLLIVNTASHCVFTPQYEGLQQLYSRFKSRGLEILAFPCDQFGHQEPGSNSEIKSFCKLNYGIEFPIFAKVDVNGENEHPLFTFLKSRKGGLLTDDIKWNFTKFLVSRKGEVVGRFAPLVPPSQLEQEIETQLATKPTRRKAARSGR